MHAEDDGEEMIMDETSDPALPPVSAVVPSTDGAQHHVSVNRFAVWSLYSVAVLIFVPVIYHPVL